MITFDNSFFRDMQGYYATAVSDDPDKPELIAFNHGLASQLGMTVVDVHSQRLADMFSGKSLPDGAQPLAFAYAGHQFGHFSPQLGDGRALLLGEVVAPDGGRFDIQLKGSGRTPFSRNGDGKAALGPVLREYLLSEAMAALGVPTTRSLCAVATGDPVYRERPLPGAVLTRVAASHMRIGTFEFFAAHGGRDHVRKLAHYALARHYSEDAEAENPCLALFKNVMTAQIALVSKWMNLGFVHGVMNTDNVGIAGETLDYGPCAFLDRYAPDAVFSSIDRQGRYAFGNQPAITRWNLHRLAEALIENIVEDGGEAAQAEAGLLLQNFGDSFRAEWLAGMRRKIGLATEMQGDLELANDLFVAITGQGVDFTQLFRRLAMAVQGNNAAVRALASDPAALDAWLGRWKARLDAEAIDPKERAEAMNAVNPLYIPRNHKVEEMIEAAVERQDFAPFFAMLEVISNPFEEREAWSAYGEPAPDSFGKYVTYCGT